MFLEQACACLQGVANRDLKLENLLLSQDCSDGRRPLLKICDFGFSKVQSGVLAATLQLSSLAVPVAWDAMASEALWKPGCSPTASFHGVAGLWAGKHRMCMPRHFLLSYSSLTSVQHLHPSPGA